MLLGYGYMRNSLVRLGGYPTHRDVAGKYLLFLFCVYTITGMARLPISRYSKRNGMNKNRNKHFRQPVETKIMQMRMYQLKLTKS